MQTMKALRLSYVALCLLTMLVISGCGQKGPLYRDAPVAVDVPEGAPDVSEAVDDARDNEKTAH
ncbi:LPS translocon maturation chaperone LptM [Marinobacter sp.]|uniref:LPS translocon maturation chaperone LptM n=1 Tax=Marinobacter sp. TaxID=50741 RepID=UPI002B26D699|nr:lipoprotein [Marinobacter sp.]